MVRNIFTFPLLVGLLTYQYYNIGFEKVHLNQHYNTDMLPNTLTFYCHRAWIHTDKVKVGVIIAVLVGAVLLLAAIASLAYWYFAKYRYRDQVKYNNLDGVEANEEETLIGDQQL